MTPEGLALWRGLAYFVIVAIARTRETFTTDDVWAELAHYPLPDERREIGAIVRKAESNGVIRATDRYVKSTRPECHSRPVPVWASAIARVATAGDNVILFPNQQSLIA